MSNKTSFTALLVYFNNIVVAGNSFKEIQFVKNLLDHKFKIKDLGKISYVLGFVIAISNKGIFMN